MPKSSSHRYVTETSSPLYLRPRRLFVDDDTNNNENDLHLRSAKCSNQIITTALARLTTRTPPSSHHTVVIRTTVQQTPLSANRKLQMIDVNVCQQEAHLSIKRLKRQTSNNCSPVLNKSTPVPLRRVSDIPQSIDDATFFFFSRNVMSIRLWHWIPHRIVNHRNESVLRWNTCKSHQSSSHSRPSLVFQDLRRRESRRELPAKEGKRVSFSLFQSIIQCFFVASRSETMQCASLQRRIPHSISAGLGRIRQRLSMRQSTRWLRVCHQEIETSHCRQFIRVGSDHLLPRRAWLALNVFVSLLGCWLGKKFVLKLCSDIRIFYNTTQHGPKMIICTFKVNFVMVSCDWSQMWTQMLVHT